MVCVVGLGQRPTKESYWAATVLILRPMKYLRDSWVRSTTIGADNSRRVRVYRRRLKYLLGAWLLTSATHAAAPMMAIGGMVYLDSNRNGVRDAGERGIGGVAVSDGSTIVRTDAAGRYRLGSEPGRTLFVIKPPQFAFARDLNGLPVFWRNLPSGNGGGNVAPQMKYGELAVIAKAASSIDFAVLPSTATDPKSPLEVLVFGDPQPKSLIDVDYYRRDIVEPILAAATIGRPPAMLGLTLGDEVSDDLSLYPAINKVTARMGVPWLHAAGNHDQDIDAPNDAHATDTFRATFGPTTWAWEEPQAEFIVLDDVVFQPGEKQNYVGGLREDQFQFLQAYLPSLPQDRLLVVAAHIPFFNAAAAGAPETFRHADRERLFALLKDFPHVLLLSAHTHNQRMEWHDASDGWHGARPLREYNVGAACGSFWSGVADANGIPGTTMSDGTPNGYARLRVGPNGDYALAWYVARLPAGDPSFTDAMALEAPKVLRRGAYAGWAVYANVFLGEATSRVEYRIDGRDWKPMQRVARADPRLQAENVADDQADALRGFDRSPEAVPSTHLWRGTLASDLAAGTHDVEVRTFDPWQGELSARIGYRLDDSDR